MPIDVQRSKILSNQIDMLFGIAYFVANGIQTQFVVPYEFYYDNMYTPGYSAEIEVYENGVLLRYMGTYSEYALVQDSFGVFNTIKFFTVPVNGHLIDVFYRIVSPKI
jgi:hypothetical protein